MTILELREKRSQAWEATKAFLESHRNEKGILLLKTMLPMSVWKRKSATSAKKLLV